MDFKSYIDVALGLEGAGLIWQPEIGDEVSFRERWEAISILVDPQGMTPKELRSTYLWLPTVEQLVTQLESRQAILFHAGLDLSEGSLEYKAIIEARSTHIEVKGMTLRTALGLGLCELLNKQPELVQ